MSSNPAPFLQAARRYGSEPGFDAWAREKYGVSGPALLAKVAKGESTFDMTAVSSAGAKGGTQFMPATREEFIKRYGVDAWKDPDSAVHATKLYLEHDKRGVAGYNPGDPSYTRYILAQKVGDLGAGGSPGGTGAASQPRRPSAAATRTVGGVDNRAARGALIASFLQGGDSRFTQGTRAAGSETSDPLSFALGIRALKDTPGHQVTTPARSSSAAAGAPAAGGSSGAYPLARTGKLIGTPYKGTHTLGNWQSDRAYDIAVPVGTPMVALQDGVIVKVTRHPQGAGRFAGDQITVRGANGNEYFYAHGSATVKAGQRVRKGQVLGRSGSANGVAHLHFAQERGDPRQHLNG